MPGVSVVIPHYWRERDANLTMIASALRASSVPPAEVLLWNNLASVAVPAGWKVVQAAQNYGPQARCVAGLLAEGEYVLFHDNDVEVGRDTLCEMLRHYHPPCVVTMDGRRLTADRRYRSSAWVRDVDEKHQVDIGLGHLELVRRDVLFKVLSTFRWGCRMDDIEFSAACRRAGVPIYVVPLKGRAQPIGLTMRGVGACFREDHYAERDRLCQELYGQAA